MRVKRQITEWEKIFAICIFTKDIWRIYTEFLQIKRRPNRKMGKSLKQALHIENIQLANKHRKRCLISSDIREIQVETIMRYDGIRTTMTESQKPDIPSDAEQPKPWPTTSGSEVGTATLENDLTLSTQSEHQHIQSPSRPIQFYSKVKCMCVHTKDGYKNVHSRTMQLPQTGNHPDVHYSKVGKWWYSHRMDSTQQWQWLCSFSMPTSEWISKHNDEWETSNTKQYNCMISFIKGTKTGEPNFCCEESDYCLSLAWGCDREGAWRNLLGCWWYSISWSGNWLHQAVHRGKFLKLHILISVYTLYFNIKFLSVKCKL